MPAPGTCDPASRGDTFNTGALQNGPVLVEYRYGWDGVSVRPDCVGPLLRIRVTNTSTTDTWWVHLRGRRGQPKLFELAPGFVGTFNQAALTNQGFIDNTDLENLQITGSPTAPSSLR